MATYYDSYNGPGAQLGYNEEGYDELEQWKQANPGLIPLIGQGNEGNYDFYGANNRDEYYKKYFGEGQYGVDENGVPFYQPTNPQSGYYGPNYNGNAGGLLGWIDDNGWKLVAGAAGAGLGSVLGGGEIIPSDFSGYTPTDYGVSSTVGTPMAETAGAAAGSVGTGGSMDIGDLWNLIDTGEAVAPWSSDPSLADLSGDYYGSSGGADFSGATGGVGGNAGDPFPTAGGSAGGGFNITDLLKNRNLLSALLGSSGQALSSYLASRAQQNLAGQASNALLSMYNQNRADLAPWRNAGATAVGQLTDLTTPGKQFDTMALDPGYQFRQAEGQKALDNRLRAGGKFYSGTAMKAGTDYNQNFASNEFNNVYNRLAGLAGTGQAATNTTAQLGQNTAAGQAGNLMGAGNARASGYVGMGNALQGGLANYQQNEMLDQLLPMLARRGY